MEDEWTMKGRRKLAQRRYQGSRQAFKPYQAQKKPPLG
jgi:hypothetical protein